MDIFKVNTLREVRYNYTFASAFGIAGLLYGLKISYGRSFKIMVSRSFVCVFVSSLFGHGIGDCVDPNGKPGSLIFEDILPKMIKE